MAIGRAGGEHRVEKAFLNALDSPLLYGSDVSKAKRILFNIYTSPDSPLFVDELQEIDAFMDELSPQIEVIWGVSDDDTLGEDAKIAILATGLDDDSGDFADKADTRFDDDAEHYHMLIKKLYSPGNGKADTTKQNPDEIKITVSNYGGTQQPDDGTPTNGGGTATDAPNGGGTDNGNTPETPPVKPATQTGNRSQTNTQTLVERLKIIWNKALKCEE